MKTVILCDVKEPEDICPEGANQKFKIYRLAQIMLERTDEEYYLDA